MGQYIIGLNSKQRRELIEKISWYPFEDECDDKGLLFAFEAQTMKPVSDELERTE
jgi:hypothetical protein